MEAYFVHKLKKGAKGKYKVKLPFKIFNYGDVRHFVAKCMYNEKRKMMRFHTKREVIVRKIQISKKATSRRKALFPITLVH